jgi:hypothetical protein
MRSRVGVRGFAQINRRGAKSAEKKKRKRKERRGYDGKL